MPTSKTIEPKPSLPQKCSDHEQKARAFQLSLARTAYNYTRSYPGLDAVALCAGVPSGEDFSADYNLKLAEVVAQIGENFLANAERIVKNEIGDDVSNIFAHYKDLLADIETLSSGLPAIAAEAVAEGPTAILKSTLFDLLRPHKQGDKDYLQATERADYDKLTDGLPKPLSLRLETEEWMPKTSDMPCEQDWFFGYLQVAGYNTTNLRGVTVNQWSELQAKMPITNKMFQDVLGDPTQTLEAAIEARKLYVCDYAALIGGADGTVDGKESDFHDKHRYLAAPIALFYWNDSPPAGYPPNGYSPRLHGVLQPIAIQLAQRHHETDAPIFTPNDCSGAEDKNGLKWKVAKYFVNVACAIQHESVAHLGDCHLIIESLNVATHRQLAKTHPLYKLLEPHLRFTISINNGAMNNLIVPGGVVATNVGPDIHWTLTLVNEARKAWRWDQNSPVNIFKARGLDALPVFPFRDDTLPLYFAIRDFVSAYVGHYYEYDKDILADTELQSWIDELTSPRAANIQGFDKLNSEGQVDTREYLIDILAQAIYIAGPQHASVNYAQYPLAGYAPSVAGAVYGQAPKATQTVSEVLSWLPPLDVALYTTSFVYLLSGIQYDRFGHYGTNPQINYFTEEPLQRALEAFQAALAGHESQIHASNQGRPMPYLFQLPSRIPNSISI